MTCGIVECDKKTEVTGTLTSDIEDLELEVKRDSYKFHLPFGRQNLMYD